MSWNTYEKGLDKERLPVYLLSFFMHWLLYAQCLHGETSSGLPTPGLTLGKAAAHKVILKLFSFIPIPEGQPRLGGDRWMDSFEKDHIL